MSAPLHLEFTDEGLLPPGDYPMTLDQLANSLLVVGPGGPGYESWNERWRRRLVENLGVLVGQLWQVGITEIFVDGSFAEDKLRPGDIDGYFVCTRDQIETGELERRLNLVDLYRVWTWDWARASVDPLTRQRKLPMWHRYHVEMWPHWGQGSDIRDQYGNELQFPAAFRKSRRTHREKGIIQIVR